MSPSNRRARLNALHKKMRACRLCLNEGHDITPGAIFSGVLDADVMLIGQAPGVTEVEAQRPFNAGSGTRLFDWLAKAGLDETAFRRDQYMTAVTKCFPGKASNGGGDRVPSRAEQALCRPYLDGEIELVDPKLILPVGRLAINIFFPVGRPLTSIIGTEIQRSGRWVIPLPHPSGASRWHQTGANRKLINKAVELIRIRLAALEL
jgi:uracil-DNA glycosylase